MPSLKRKPLSEFEEFKSRKKRKIESKTDITPSVEMKEDVVIDLDEVEKLERALIQFSQVSKSFNTIVLGLHAYLRYQILAVVQGKISASRAFHRAKIVTSLVLFYGKITISKKDLQKWILEPLAILRDKVKKEDKKEDSLLYNADEIRHYKFQLSWWKLENDAETKGNFPLTNVELETKLTLLRNLVPILDAIDLTGIGIEYKLQDKLEKDREEILPVLIAYNRLDQLGEYNEKTPDYIDLLAQQLVQMNSGKIPVHIEIPSY